MGVLPYLVLSLGLGLRSSAVDRPFWRLGWRRLARHFWSRKHFDLIAGAIVSFGAGAFRCFSAACWIVCWVRACSYRVSCRKWDSAGASFDVEEGVTSGGDQGWVSPRASFAGVA